MRTFIAYVCVPLLVLCLYAPGAFAQSGPTDTQGRVYTQAELDQMLAPVALYPDPLLSQVLMAATYPLEVVEAARWSRAHPGLDGDKAVRAADDQDWDPSVKSLLAFPWIITMMDDKLDWTERLGDAFLAQQSEVMDTVQELRRRAQAAGNLQSNDHQRIESAEGDTIVIEPSNPDVVYVPYYNPVVVYGSWWWPDYPPVYWPPWPGYYVTPGFAGFGWGAGVAVGAHFFFGAWDWHRHHVRIRPVRPFYYHPPRHPAGRPPGHRPANPPSSPGGFWHHNPQHRHGVPYRTPKVREQFRPHIGSPAQRRDYRGFIIPGQGPGWESPGVRSTPQRRDYRGSIIPGQGPGWESPGVRGTPQQRDYRGSIVPGQGPGWESPGARSTLQRRDYRGSIIPGQGPGPVGGTRQGPAARRSPQPGTNLFEDIGRGGGVRRDSQRGRESLRQFPSLPSGKGGTIWRPQKGGK
ncbi:MAG: DUF3300 domain-containing protein [Arenicellales bacterium]